MNRVLDLGGGFGVAGEAGGCYFGAGLEILLKNVELAMVGRGSLLARCGCFPCLVCVIGLGEREGRVGNGRVGRYRLIPEQAG